MKDKDGDKPKKAGLSGRPAAGMSFNELREVEVTTPTIIKLTGGAANQNTLERKTAQIKFRLEGGVRLYNLHEALMLILKKERTQGDLDPAHERARKDKAQADLYETELATKQGKLYDAGEVEMFVEGIARTVEKWVETVTANDDQKKELMADLQKMIDDRNKPIDDDQ